MKIVMKNKESAPIVMKKKGKEGCLQEGKRFIKKLPQAAKLEGSY